METTIYFFTGTGNSLKIAKFLAERLGDCKLVPIAKVWQMERVESVSKNVGFIFPLYYFGLPKIVYDFMEKLSPDRSYYFFTVITSAEDKIELPFLQINNMLKVKGKKLSAGFIINMPNNYVLGPRSDGHDVSSEAYKKRLFDSMPEEIQLISENIKKKQVNISENIFEKVIDRHISVSDTFRDEVNEMDKSFYVTDSCSNCGICEKACPVSNIRLINGVPEWQHKCQLCLACINFCPERAIQFGTDTLKTGRYHHPEILLQEIINQKE